MTRLEFQALPAPASRLGESPLWVAHEEALYWCDIPGRSLHRWHPDTLMHRSWAFDSEPACVAPSADGALVLAMRDGIWRFDPASGERQALAAPPYDVALERFNDGKAGPDGGFWVGTIYEPRDPPLAALYRWRPDGLRRMADGITTSNGLAWSPDGDTLYWTDTKAHCIRAFDGVRGADALPAPRVLAQFPPRQPGQSLEDYGGRPDGAAVDAEGAYWCAMFEGQRLLRLAPDGRVLAEVPLPVRCPTMPCLGGPDGRTLYVTTAREGRPAEELASQPLAGRVLQARVDVPGLPAHQVRL